MNNSADSADSTICTICFVPRATKTGAALHSGIVGAMIANREATREYLNLVALKLNEKEQEEKKYANNMMTYNCS
jgi:hypothetical protein